METAISTAFITTKRIYSKVYWRSEQEKRECEIRAKRHGYEKPCGDADMSSYLRSMAKFGILKKIMDNFIDEFVEKVNKKINIVMRIREH